MQCSYVVVSFVVVSFSHRGITVLLPGKSWHILTLFILLLMHLSQLIAWYVQIMSRLRHTRWSRQAISAFAAAATTAALVYCQSLQAAPMVPEARKGQNTSIHTKPFKHCLLISMTSLNIMNSITCLGNTFNVSFLDVLWECVSYILETHWAWHRLQMILYFINWYGLTSSNFGSEPYWRWINEPGWKTHTLARFWGDRFPWPDPMLLGGALSA